MIINESMPEYENIKLFLIDNARSNEKRKGSFMKIDALITKTAVARPVTTILIFLFITVYAVTLLSGLKKDPSPYLLPPEHESRVGLEKLRSDYTGAGDGIFILLEAKDTVFKQTTLQRIKNLTDEFENLNIITPKDLALMREKGLLLGGNSGKSLVSFSGNKIDEESWQNFEEIYETAREEGLLTNELQDFFETITLKLSPTIKVSSLSNTDNILGKKGELDVSPIFEEVPATPEGLDKIKRNVQGNSLFRNTLVTPDGKYSTIVIELALPASEVEGRSLLYERIKTILKDKVPGDELIYVAGDPVASAVMSKTMQTDTGRLFPIVLLIVTVCLFITFRMIKGIFIPLSVVILTLIITLAVKAFFNIPLNIITTALPVFILSIGVADGIHMFSEYRDQLLKGLNKKDAVIETLRHLTTPVIMTSFTTAAAFYSISLTEIVQLKHFGIFVAVGTIVAMIFSLLFIPALLLVLPERMTKKEKRSSAIEASYSKILIYVTRVITGKPIQTSFIAVIILIIAVIGSTKVIVNNNNVEYFMDDSEILISTNKMNAVAGGSSILNYLVEINPSEKSSFKNHENIKVIEAFTTFIEKQDKVGKVRGLNKLIKRINYVLNDENEKFNRLPEITNSEDGKNIISQLLFLYENGGGDTLSDLTDSNYKKLNIPVVLKTNASRDMYLLTNIIEDYAKNNFPENMTLHVSGHANLSVASTEEIVFGQIVSLAASVVIVLAMLFLTFRSFWFSFIAMLPLVMTIAVNFGIMGFMKIPLDIGTAVLSSIVIGIGVDYGIHYISRYRSNIKEGMDFQKAIEDTAQHSGKAIVSNAVTVALGFCALLFSVLTPLIVIGWMVCLTMIMSALCTMVLIPAFLSINAQSGNSNNIKKYRNNAPQMRDAA